MNLNPHVLSLVLTLSLSVGCAPKPPEAPPPQPIAAPTPPKPPPAALTEVSPNVRVSEEILAACKLHFDDVRSAPKFAFDSSDVATQDAQILSQIAKCMTTGPLAGRTLELVGRADPRGAEEYNMALGDRRANTIRDHLSGLGMALDKLAPSSRGKLDAVGTDEDGWQRDRRVDISLR